MDQPQQPDLSEVSYAGDSFDLGLDSKAPAFPVPKPVVEAAVDAVDMAGEMTADYSTLLTEPISSKTQFGQAAIKLESQGSKSAVMPAVSDEQGLGYGWNELPLVLSHYDLGTIKRIEAFKRGSRRAPKAVMAAEAGVFLLKRRDATDETRSRIIVAHRVQRHLAAARFPSPPLVATRRSGSTLVHLGDHLYELFLFVRGEPFDRSPEASGSAGRALGRMHKILENFERPQEAPRGSFHQSPVAPRAFERARETFGRLLPAAALPGGLAHLAALQRDLKTAADMADDLGANQGEEKICHGDWHPGNLIYNGERKVIGVVDYDSIRLQNPLLDVATGALQFSAVGGADPSKWPDEPDVGRFTSFMRGYLRETGLEPARMQAVPWLMAEAMVTEVLLPVASRGAFAGIRGDLMLGVIRRKMAWLMVNAKPLHEAMLEAVGGHSF